MDVINVNINENCSIYLGINGENMVTSVHFNVDDWIHHNPPLEQGGRYILYIRMPNDKEIKQQELPVVGNIVKWDIKIQDLKNTGRGQVQLYYKANNGQVIASDIYNTRVSKCL